MGVRVSQYGREMDKSKKGESLQERHKKAVEISKVTRTGKKAESEEGLLKKTKRRLKELWGGEKTYLPKDKKSKKSTRTKQVEGGLKQAGLSAEDIKKFQKK